MKKLFGPTWLGAWLTGILPDSLFRLGKKTPWYRQSWLRTVPWVGVALAAPFIVFLLWKGVALVISKGDSGTSDAAP